MAIQVLFADRYCIVAVKPAGVPAQPDPTGDRDFLTLLSAQLQQERALDYVPELFPVLRLDRPVGGVTLVARSSKAHASFDELIRSRKIDKRYLAVHAGKLPSPEGELRHFLFKIEKLNFSKVVKEGKSGSKEALLRYRVRQEAENFGLAEIELVTGRHHQIRAQLAEAGCALWGDRKYGRWPSQIKGFGLWAWKLSFRHPVTGEELDFESLPPSGEEPWRQFEGF